MSNQCRHGCGLPGYVVNATSNIESHERYCLNNPALRSCKTCLHGNKNGRCEKTWLIFMRDCQEWKGNDKYKEIRALSKDDRKEIYDYAMKRSRDILNGEEMR